MDAKNRNPSDAVNRLGADRLEREGRRYEYLQLLRMLRLLGGPARRRGSPWRVRTRASLTLAVEAEEVAQLRRLGDAGWAITTNVFGLYGVGSPLPLYYTEQLLDEQREGRGAARGLIDLVHELLHPLLFQAWEKHRVAQRVVEAGDMRLLAGLQGFAGIVPARPESSPGLAPLLHLALLQQGPRSAAGLRRLLALELHPATVRIGQHQRRLAPLPRGQRGRLGLRNHQLGCDSRIGSHVDDASGSLRVELRGLDPEGLRQLLPGGAGRRRLESLLARYLRDPLRVDIWLQVRADPCPPAPRLGAAGSPRVGLGAWLGAAGTRPAPVYAGSWEPGEPALRRAEPGFLDA